MYSCQLSVQMWTTGDMELSSLKVNEVVGIHATVGVAAAVRT